MIPKNKKNVWHCILGRMEAFLRRTLSLAIEDFEAARALAGPVFFDRGIIDALSGLQHLTGRAPEDAARLYRYAETVFLAPPWPEIWRPPSHSCVALTKTPC